MLVQQRARAIVPAIALLLACTPAPSIDDAPVVACSSDLPGDSNCPDVAPSYLDEIEPLVFSHCGGCHYAGNRNSKQVLETYDDLKDSISVVEKAVYRCEMPPAGEPRLAEAERRALLQWLVCGAPHN
jgi:uncharacterized membrane protein